MEKSLKWKANIIYEEDDQERDWVLVDGKTTDITGIGNSNVAITVVNTTKASSILNARVEFIYYDENDKEIIRKYVNVCRCLLCGCDNLEFWPEPCNCDMLDFWPDPCNCDKFEIVDVQMLCGCDRFEIDQTPLSWEWEETKVIEIPFTRNCIDSELSLSVTSSTANHFNAVLTENSVKVNPSDENSGEAPITGTLTISYSSPQEPNCSKDIELTHKFSNCQCGVLTVSQRSASWVWNNKTAKTIDVTATDECIKFNSISVTITGTNSSDFNVSSAFTEATRTGTITVSPKNLNKSTTNNLTADVVITYASGSKPSCTEKISLTHNKMTCNCTYFDITNVVIPFNNN